MWGFCMKLDIIIADRLGKSTLTYEESVGLSPGNLPREEVLALSLCYRCKCELEDAGRILVKRGWQAYKEPCDRCQTGMGLNYGVFERDVSKSLHFSIMNKLNK